jgi:hypothetical protein
MKRVIVLLVAGTLVSAIGAVWASAHPKPAPEARPGGNG